MFIKQCLINIFGPIRRTLSMLLDPGEERVKNLDWKLWFKRKSGGSGSPKFRSFLKLEFLNWKFGSKLTLLIILIYERAIRDILDDILPCKNPIKRLSSMQHKRIQKFKPNDIFKFVHYYGYSAAYSRRNTLTMTQSIV